MCGIAGIHRRTDKPFPKMGRLANELHLGIEDRGRDSSGFLAMLDSGKVQTERAVVAASRFVRKRPKFSEDARTVLLHTRYATVGKVTVANAHPIISGTCAAVHNGTISNADELFKAFGLKRRAQVDSEIIPALLTHAGWEQAEDALELMRGGAATAVVTSDRPRELLLARLRTYPLVAMVTDDFIVWASTERAIVSAWHFTYREAPPRDAEWMRLAEHSALRVNGADLDYRRIPQAKPVFAKPKPKGKAKPRGKATSGTTAKRRRKAGRKAGGTQPSTSAPQSRSKGTRAQTGATTLPTAADRQRASWDREMVWDLARAAGISVADAQAMISDYDEEPEGWRERLWNESDLTVGGNLLY
jgi:Glutamine amidotransferase domain